MINMKTLSCVIMSAPATPAELLSIQLVENALREDLRPVEQARAYRQLMEANGWSAAGLAGELNVNPSTVARALALLDLPGPVQEAVEQGDLPAQSAYEISKLPDPRMQAAVAAAAVQEDLPRTEIVELVKQIKSRRKPAAKRQDTNVDLGDCTVTIKWRKSSELAPAQALRIAADICEQRGEAAA
jgi:ParB family chromosome partitioning protein